MNPHAFPFSLPPKSSATNRAHILSFDSSIHILSTSFFCWITLDKISFIIEIYVVDIFFFLISAFL